MNYGLLTVKRTRRRPLAGLMAGRMRTLTTSVTPSPDGVALSSREQAGPLFQTRRPALVSTV